MAADYALSRSKALQSVESAVSRSVFAAARQIVALSTKYRRGARLVSERAFAEAARLVTASLVDAVEQEISRFAMASASILGIGSKDIGAFLSSEIHGATSRERTAKYLANFAEDMVRMSKAGILMGYSEQKILAAVRTGYRNPYVTSVITKARKKDVNIATPSYGRGIFHSAYQNLVRNARQMVALAWGMAEQQYGKEHGAIGYRVYRGSSYLCSICDDETAYIHHFGDPYPPFHLNCRCWIKFIYSEEDSEE